MIKMVACGELQDTHTRPQTSDSQFRYVWAPKHSQINRKNTNPNQNSNNYYYHTNNDSSEEFVFPSQYKNMEEGYGGLSGMVDDAPFKLPENDTIIRTAHQLSRLASRNSSRVAAMEGAKGLSVLAKEKVRNDDINKTLGQKLREYTMQDAKSKRQRSASLNLPRSTRNIGGQSSAAVKKGRSRSVNSEGSEERRDRLPTIPGPVNVSVTKETIPKGGSGSARLRYTSHWGGEA